MALRSPGPSTAVRFGAADVGGRRHQHRGAISRASRRGGRTDRATTLTLRGSTPKVVARLPSGGSDPNRVATSVRSRIDRSDRSRSRPRGRRRDSSYRATTPCSSTVRMGGVSGHSSRGRTSTGKRYRKKITEPTGALGHPTAGSSCRLCRWSKFRSTAAHRRETSTPPWRFASLDRNGGWPGGAGVTRGPFRAGPRTEHLAQPTSIGQTCQACRSSPPILMEPLWKVRNHHQPDGLILTNAHVGHRAHLHREAPTAGPDPLVPDRGWPRRPSPSRTQYAPPPSSPTAISTSR